MGDPRISQTSDLHSRYRSARHLSLEFGAALALFATLAAGCALIPPRSFLDPTKVGTFATDYREAGIRRWLTPLETPPGVPDATEPTPEDLVPSFGEYRIGRADGVGVSIEDLRVGGTPFQVGLEVDNLGNIRIPEIGSLHVLGMTEPELEQELRDRIVAAGLLPDPVVQVFVTNKRKKTFSITGSVRQAGPYPLPRADIRLLDMLGMVGDIGPEARTLYVIRRTEPEWATEDAQPGVDEVNTPDDGLVIPPPDDGDDGDDSGDPGFSATVFSRLEASAQDSQSQPTRDELDALIAPSQPATQTTQASRPAGERPFAPLVFDPETGQLVEAPAAQSQDSTQTQTSSEPFAQLPEDEDFNWDEVPEYELTQRVIKIDVGALRSGDPRQNIVLRDRDSIWVPVDNGVFYVVGEVNRPGVYAFNGREITVKQAIATVGGFSSLAWPSRCEIVRKEEGTDKQITIPVNLDSVFAGLEDDFYLRDQDILNVGTDIVAPFLFVIRNSFRFTYGFGFVYDRNFADKDSFGGRINPETRRIQRRQSRGLPF